jgi:hypothetical protein
MTGTDICGYASMLSRPGGTTLRGLANAHQRVCHSLLPTSAKGLPRRTSKKSFITFIQLRATVWAWDWQSAVRSSSHTAAVDQRKHRIELDPCGSCDPKSTGLTQSATVGNADLPAPRSQGLRPCWSSSVGRGAEEPPPTHCGHPELAPRSDRGPLSRDADWGDRAE